MKNWQRLRHNPEWMESFLMRETVIDAIRVFFKQQGFHEVETPLMVNSPGMEPYLEVFETCLKDHNGAEHRAFLTTSPEYSMKKLLVAGLPKIFQICKAFRNGEDLRSSSHNPEFTILEWYRAEASYFEIMDDCEELVRFIYDYRERQKSNVKSEMFNSIDAGNIASGDSLLETSYDSRWLEYQGKRMDLSLPWERITVAQAFEKYAGVTTDDLLDEERLKEVAVGKGYRAEASTWEQAYNQIFLNEIEPHFGWERPTILYEYPASQAALSQRKKDDPRFAERFEFYIFGKELGNAFGELTDAAEQEVRLRAEYEERKRLGKTMYELDQDFIEALKAGMPKAGGIAVGVDRLVMLFADVETIQETLWFPAEEIVW